MLVEFINVSSVMNVSLSLDYLHLLVFYLYEMEPTHRVVSSPAPRSWKEGDGSVRHCPGFPQLPAGVEWAVVDVQRPVHGAPERKLLAC